MTNPLRKGPSGPRAIGDTLKKIHLLTIIHEMLTSGNANQTFDSIPIPNNLLPLGFSYNIKELFRSGAADPSVTQFTLQPPGVAQFGIYVARTNIRQLSTGQTVLETGTVLQFTVFANDATPVNLATTGEIDIWALLADSSIP